MGDDPDERCPLCDAPMEWVRCWVGCDDGFVEDDDWGDGITRGESCCECGGLGGYLECTRLPHSDEQMKDFKRSMG